MFFESFNQLKNEDKKLDSKVIKFEDIMKILSTNPSEREEGEIDDPSTYFSKK